MGFLFWKVRAAVVTDYRMISDFVCKTELLTLISVEERWEMGTLRQKTPKANKTNPIFTIF